MIENKEVKELFNKEVKAYNAFFGDYEQIKKFRLIAEEWTGDNFLSQTLKTKRKVIEKFYEKEIEALFV
jgi:long-chain acyl-CoA synthetase